MLEKSKLYYSKQRLSGMSYGGYVPEVDTREAEPVHEYEPVDRSKQMNQEVVVRDNSHREHNQESTDGLEY